VGGWGGAAAAGGAEGGLAGGSGAWRRRWWEAAGGSAGPSGPGDGGRGGLPGGQAAVASVRGPYGLSFGLGPHGGGGSERRSWACAAHSGLEGRHGAGHERGGAPGPSGEWRPRRAREAGAVGPVGGLPGGLCEGVARRG
jgi:type IV secretion system protein TrbL